MTVNTFVVAKTYQGDNTLIGSASFHTNAQVLAAETAGAITVPLEADVVIFSANTDFYALPNGTAAVPSAAVTDGSASQLNPTGWVLRGQGVDTAVESISVISENALKITASFFKLPKE